MKRFKNLFFYIAVIGVFTYLMYWIVILGSKLEIGREITKITGTQTQWNIFLNTIHHNIKHPLAILLIQIITIILIARLFGWVCSKIGQPTVIGEIIAGIILGPSLLGMFFPEFSLALFPKESLGNLQFLSQIGLILFMFVIGLELDIKVLKNKANDSVIISHASIIIPFALGMGLAYFIYDSFAPNNISFLAFALFLGIAMSITAFPVLARIVQERGLHKTRIGVVVITCAAADDITAWCILAAVIAIVKAGSFFSALYIIVAAIVYVLVMLQIVRPFLKRVGDIYASKQKLSKPIVAIFFIVLLISSYTTEVIGIHALFGAFMTGAIMPENTKFRNIFIEKVEDVSLVLLLPLFFVFTGLRTQIGLIKDIYLWEVTGLIILVAVAGKLLGSALAARFVGQSWKDSFIIGTLMNTRGLMELVVLNIGYDLGVLGPEIFSMMVIMALVTTLMTGPVLNFINWIYKNDILPVIDVSFKTYNVLVSIGNPQSARKLLRIASIFVPKNENNITVMHLVPVNELNQFNANEYEKESFIPVIDESKKINQKIITLFKASNDIDTDIVEVTNKNEFDLLIMGYGQSIYEGTLLGKFLGFTTKIIDPDRIMNTVIGKEKLFESNLFDERTNQVLNKSQIPVGIFIDKNFKEANKIIFLLFNKTDIELLEYGQKVVQNSQIQLTIYDVNGTLKNDFTFQESINSLLTIYPDLIQLVNKDDYTDSLFSNQDLLIISLENYKNIVEEENKMNQYFPSTLIIRF